MPLLLKVAFSYLWDTNAFYYRVFFCTVGRVCIAISISIGER
jgi:hypothetical protein